MCIYNPSLKKDYCILQVATLLRYSHQQTSGHSSVLTIRQAMTGSMRTCSTLCSFRNSQIMSTHEAKSIWLPMLSCATLSSISSYIHVHPEIYLIPVLFPEGTIQSDPFSLIAFWILILVQTFCLKGIKMQFIVHI